MVPSERALVTFYRPSIVTFPLSLRVSEILPLLFSSMPLFPTPPLVSPKFPHVPMEVGGSSFGYKERICWANCPLQLVSKISNLCDYNPPTSQTGGQADGRTTCDRKVHCAVKRTVSENDGPSGMSIHKLYNVASLKRSLHLCDFFSLQKKVQRSL